MYLPKHDIYTALSTIPSVTVLQGSQKTIVNVPAITFFISDNTTELDLSNEISNQNIEVTIDIWAQNSTDADGLLTQIETNIRALGYRLSYCTDVPDPENICHINTRFSGIK